MDERINKLLKKINQENVLMIVILILVLLLALFSFNPRLLDKLKFEGKKSLDVVRIEGCEECFDLNLIVNSLKESIAVKEKIIDYNSEEAKKLIDKYRIQTIPALIAKGKIDELEKNIFRIEGKAAIFDKSVPYLDLDTGKIIGFVNALELYDSSCLDCSSLTKVKQQLERTGIKFKDYEMVDAKSEKGKTIIKENNISFMPSILLSENIEEYWWIFPNIENSFIKKEHYVLKNPIAPYKDIKSGLVKGKVIITYITNRSCSDCYNVTILKELFAGIGIYIDKEKYVDINTIEGKNLIASYNIKAVPTAILSREISDYNLKNILEKVGNFTNKEFVLTELDSLNLKYQKINN